MWATTAVGLLALAAFLPTLQAEGTGEADVFLQETEAVAGQEVLVEHFDAGQVEPVVVITAEDTAEEALEVIGAVDGIEDAQVVAGEDGAPVVVDGRVEIQATTAATAESQEATVAAGDVRQAVRDVDPDALVGGAAAQRLDTQETAAQDLRTIVPIVLAVIFVMLVILLRSIVAPLVILAVNVLSFAATLGLSAIFFNHVFGFPGADASVPLFGFVFLVALSIDYSIFLMTRVREESLEHGTRAGVRRGLAMTGGVITSAGLVLAATFGALVVIPLLFLVQLAFIVAVGVLIDTFIVRSLLVSGLVYDIGRPVWWPWKARIPEDREADDDAPAPVERGPKHAAVGERDMTTQRSPRVRQVVVTLTYLVCLAGSFIGSGAFGGTPIAEAAGGLLSADATHLAPDSPAFSVWSVIYTALGAYTVWQWWDRTDERRIAWLVVASLVLNAAWVLAVQAGAVALTVVVIVALLAVLAEAFRRLLTARPRSRVEAVVADGTVGIYLGWVSVATCANIAAALLGAGFTGGDSPELWAVAVLAAVAAVGVALAVVGRGRLAPAATQVWGLSWIAIGRTTGDPESTTTAVAAVVAAAIIAVVTVACRVRATTAPTRQERT